MKVLHLCKYDFRFERGGIESVCKNMFHYFRAQNETAEADYQYFLFFSKTKTSFEYTEANCTLYNAGLTVHTGSTSISLAYFKKYFALCNRFDVVHVHVPNPIAFLALWLYFPKGKIVVHWHSDIVKQKHTYPLFKRIEKKVLQHASAIIATSENYINGSRPLAPFKDKISVIPIGIQPLPLLPANGGGRNLILSIGRLVYYKGFDYLIKAAQYLPDGYEVIIVGDGELKASFEQLIQQLHLSHKVKLMGSVTDECLAELMSSCRLFCLPSVERSEAFGVVLLEALSLGKPIVATNLPFSGVNWVNKHGVTGLNVAVKNEKQLADAIISILSNQPLYNAFSRNAQARFRQLFTAAAMNESIHRLYQSLHNTEVAKLATVIS